MKLLHLKSEVSFKLQEMVKFMVSVQLKFPGPFVISDSQGGFGDE
jgi:hypothetical protein